MRSPVRIGGEAWRSAPADDPGTDNCPAVEPDQNNPIVNNPGFPITLADARGGICAQRARREAEVPAVLLDADELRRRLERADHVRLALRRATRELLEMGMKALEARTGESRECALDRGPEPLVGGQQPQAPRAHGP